MALLNMAKELAVFVVISSGVALGGDDPGDNHESIMREYDKKQIELDRGYVAAKTDDERHLFVKESRKVDLEFAHRFLAEAIDHPRASHVVDSLASVVQLGGLSRDADEAIRRLRTDYVEDKRLALHCNEIYKSINPQVEDLLREVMAKTPDRVTRGQACFCLAQSLAWRSMVPFHRDQDPALTASYEAQFGKTVIDALATRGSEAMVEEAKTLFTKVVDEFADISLFPGYPTETRTIGVQARNWLAERETMAVGHPAPEIVGVDLEGKTLKLSDYRGKVVVLIFWATWCAPCRDMVPQERELMRHFAGPRFAILGVNCDYKTDTAKVYAQREGMSWPNWFDGGKPPGPIAQLYHAQGVPHTYVIDERGIIRHKENRGEGLQKAVESIFKETP